MKYFFPLVYVPNFKDLHSPILHTKTMTAWDNKGSVFEPASHRTWDCSGMREGVTGPNHPDGFVTVGRLEPESYYPVPTTP